jgi:type I restriction enzyme S subunit
VDYDYPNLFLSDKTLRLVPKTGVDPSSLVAVLATSNARTQIQMSGTGSSGSMKNISQGAIRQLSVGWPADPEEQTRIGSLNKSQLDVISKLRATADSLRSLRTELLSALLSGAHRIPETYDELMGRTQ